MPLNVTKLGSYAIVSQLSIGDTSEVYLARQDGIAGFARQVVVKCVPAHLASDATFVERFRDEAQLVARLSHPNIVPVHEFSQQGDVHYLVMEYIPGLSLERAMARHLGLPPEHAFRVASEVCSGLDYAHAFARGEGGGTGIVHRNLMPQNVLLGLDGSVKLIDFGVARAAMLSPEARTTYFKGKHAYLAPEQARGEPADRRADIHAVGVVLWEMLMGVALYDRGNAVDTLESVVHGKPTSVRRRHPDLPPKLDDIIAKATAKTPADRYESCAALQDDIDELVATTGFIASSTSLGRLVQACVDAERDEARTSAAPSSEDRLRTVPYPSSRGGVDEGAATTLRRDDPTIQCPPSFPVVDGKIAAPPLADVAVATIGSDDPERLDPTIPRPPRHSSAPPPPRQAVTGEELMAQALSPRRPSTSPPPSSPTSSAPPPPLRPSGAPPPTLSVPPPPLTPSIVPTPPPEAVEPARGFHLWIVLAALGVVITAAAILIVLWRDVGPAQVAGLFTGGAARPTAPVRPLSKAAPLVVPPLAPTPAAPVDAAPATPERPPDAAPPVDDLPLAFLTLWSEPTGAQLYLDESPTREWTKIRDLPLDPGEHVIELVAQGYVRWRRTIDAKQGERLFFRVSLEPRGDLMTDAAPPPDAAAADVGLLSVTTAPTASAFIGRKNLGATPIEDTELVAGVYDLTFVLEKNRRVTKTVRIEAGRTTRVHFDLGEPGADAGTPPAPAPPPPSQAPPPQAPAPPPAAAPPPAKAPVPRPAPAASPRDGGP